MLLLLGELDIIRQLPHLTVDESTGIAVPAKQLQQILELTFAPTYHRRKYLKSRTFRIRQQCVDHLLRGLRADQRTAFRTMRNTGTGEQQSQVIIDFGDGSDGGTRITGSRFLIDRNSRR